MRAIYKALTAALVLCPVLALAVNPLQRDVPPAVADGDEDIGSREMAAWIDRLLDVPYVAAKIPPRAAAPLLQLVRQDYETLERNQSVSPGCRTVFGPFPRVLLMLCAC
jgi:hypothetical protein